MPKNIDLIDDINALADERGESAPVTDGMSNNKLSAMLSDMKNPKVEAETEVEVETKTVETTHPQYYIADGKSLTTLKGIRGPGDEIKADYLADGKDGLKRHVKSGLVIKS